MRARSDRTDTRGPLWLASDLVSRVARLPFSLVGVWIFLSGAPAEDGGRVNHVGGGTSPIHPTRSLRI